MISKIMALVSGAGERRIPNHKMVSRAYIIPREDEEGKLPRRVEASSVEYLATNGAREWLRID